MAAARARGASRGASPSPKSPSARNRPGRGASPGIDSSGSGRESKDSGRPRDDDDESEPFHRSDGDEPDLVPAGGDKDWPGRAPLPSRDTQVFEDAQVWLDEKAQADQARSPGLSSDLWCVHGKLYDLRQFAKRHPGGAEWFAFTKGQDVTELFETHHLDIDVAKSTLAKYFVRDAPARAGTGRGKGAHGATDRAGFEPFFTFEEGGFYKDMQRRVRKLLPRKEDRKATSAMVAYCWLALMSWCGLLAAMAATGDWWTAVAAGVLLHVLFCIGHDKFHQANNLWMLCTDLALFSSHWWRVTHAISHHHFSNTEVDIEASLVEPFVYFLTSRPKNNFLALIYGLPFYAASSMLDYLVRLVRVLIGKLPWRHEFAFGLIEAGILVHFQGWSHGLALFAAMHMVAMLLMIGLSSLLHRTSYAWTAGDEGAQRDFGAHIVVSTTDHSMSTSLFTSLFVFGLFNDHVLHHLFPSVDMSRLRGPVYKALLECCKDHNLPYRCVPVYTLFLDSISGIWRRGYKAPEGRKMGLSQ